MFLTTNKSQLVDKLKTSRHQTKDFLSIINFNTS